MSDRTHPPKFFASLLKSYCPDNLLEEIQGDLEEQFLLDIEYHGLFHADLNYAFAVISFFNPSTFRKSAFLRRSQPYFQKSNPLTMWQNYLMIAWRNFKRQRLNSLINMSGLVAGLTAFILISLFAYDEFQYDKFHPEVERTYRLYTGDVSPDNYGSWAGSSPAVGPSMKKDLPEVEEFLRLFQIIQKQLFVYNNRSFLEEKGYFAESKIFDFFHLPMIHGDPATSLTGRDKVVLSSTLALKIFGRQDVVGEIVKVGQKEATVSGVLDTRSPHFHLDFDYLLPFQNLLDQVSEERMQSWVWQDFTTYIRTSQVDDQKGLLAKLPAYIEANAHPHTLPNGFAYHIRLQNLKDIHLHSAELQGDAAVRGNYQYVLGMIIVGWIILIIACINFINLSTAKALKRSKEVGIRKVVGAVKSQLVQQFLMEAVFLVVVAMVIACLLTPLILPWLNSFTGKELHFHPFSQPIIGLALLALTVITAFLAGTYPAFVLSGVTTKRQGMMQLLTKDHSLQWLRKGLVVGQFSLSILLIVGVLVIFKQVQYMNKTDLGFQKEQLLHFQMRGNIFQNIETTKALFEQVPGVSSVSSCFGIPGDIISGDMIIVPGEEKKTLPARLFAVDHNYISTIGLELIAGREFSEEFVTDKTNAFIINETAVAQLGLGQIPNDAIGKDLEWYMWSNQDSLKKGKVIGVVKDFHYNSLHEKIQTAVLHIDPASTWKMVIRTATSDMPATLAGLTDVWDQLETGYPLDYSFVNESFGKMYESEQSLSDLLWAFSLLAILIACIGIFGLSTYSVQQRRTEIGIRKVLGASVVNIVGMLSKEYVRLVLIALIVATPIAWYLMYNWLQDFPYRIELDIWTFVLAGSTILIIAGLTVSYQNLRAALSNPVNAIRD